MIPIHQFRQTIINVIEDLLRKYQEAVLEELESTMFEEYESLSKADVYLLSARLVEERFTNRVTACDFIENKIKSMLSKQPKEQVILLLTKQLNNQP